VSGITEALTLAPCQMLAALEGARMNHAIANAPKRGTAADFMAILAGAGL